MKLNKHTKYQFLVDFWDTQGQVHSLDFKGYIKKGEHQDEMQVLYIEVWGELNITNKSILPDG